MSEIGTPPLSIAGVQKLRGIEYVMPIASAQVKSCLLLAGLYAEGCTTIIEPTQSRDHTERMLHQFSYPVAINGNQISLCGNEHLQPAHIVIPGDISSAAFFIVAACITPHSFLRLSRVGINPTRIGIIKILNLMGANISIENEQHHLTEPVADLTVQYSKLKGITIPAEYVVSAIDEFPIIFIAAACATGETILRGARELRVKESDRISAMAEGLIKLGIVCEVLEDGLVIQGGQLKGGNLNSYGDHRIAMAFAVAGNVAKDTITINNCDNVDTSFPNFVHLAQEIGMNIEVLSI